MGSWHDWGEGDCDDWGRAKRTSLDGLPGWIVWGGWKSVRAGLGGMSVGLELGRLVLGDDNRTVRSPADQGTVVGSCHSLESVVEVLGRLLACDC